MITKVIYYNPEGTASITVSKDVHFLINSRVLTNDFNDVLIYIRENDLPHRLIESEEGIDTVVGTRPPSSKH